jgi:hypothetical protein
MTLRKNLDREGRRRAGAEAHDHVILNQLHGLPPRLHA